jgi:hypothetical protein
MLFNCNGYVTLNGRMIVNDNWKGHESKENQITFVTVDHTPLSLLNMKNKPSGN